MNIAEEGPKPILSIDDEEDTTAHVIGVLQDAGHPVLEKRDRERAGEIVRRVAIRAIILDSRFPGTNGLEFHAGLEFVRRLKNGVYGELNRRVPFAVLTSFPHEVGAASFLDIQGFCPPVLSKLSADAADVCRVLGIDATSAEIASDGEYWLEDLLQVDQKSNADGQFFFVVPAWPGGHGVYVDANSLPEDVRVELEWGDYPVFVWAQVNVDADDADGVRPRGFRLGSVDDAELLEFERGV